MDHAQKPKVLEHFVDLNIVGIAKEMGIDFIPIVQEFLPTALAMMSHGEIQNVQPNPSTGRWHHY